MLLLVVERGPSLGGAPPPPSSRVSAISDLPDLSRLQALRTLNDLEFDFLPFGERAEAFLDDLGVMHEYVWTLAFLLEDEAKTLCVVEPLHSATCHVRLLLPVFAAEHARLLAPTPL